MYAEVIMKAALLFAVFRDGYVPEGTTGRFPYALKVTLHVSIRRPFDPLSLSPFGKATGLHQNAGQMDGSERQGHKP